MRGMESVAVVGLGQMGSGIALSLARSGQVVLGVDPLGRPDVAGVEQVDLATAVGRCEVVVLSLPGSEQVEDVLTGPDGLLALDLQPRLVVDTSTSDPQVTRRLAARMTEAGHVLVDAPVSGGPSGAREGALTVFLGCPDEHVDRVRWVLEPVSATVNHVGDVGAGNVAKLVNNLLCGIHLAAAREAWGLAQAAGIDPARLLTAINGASGRSAVTEVNMPRWVLSGTYDSGFPVGLMSRDVTLAAGVAEQLGVSGPLSGTAVDLWQQLREDVGPHADFNRMVNL